MDSGLRVGGRGFGLLGYIFVGMTAAVTLMAVAVVLVAVAARAPAEAVPADMSAVQR